MVLGRGPDHRRPADIDILDTGGEIGTAGQRLGKGIEVHHQQAEGRNALPRQRLAVRRVALVGEQAAMDRRVQGLDPTAKDLREPGNVRNLAHGQPFVSQQAGGPAGRNQFKAKVDERPGKGHQPRLVRYGKEGAFGDIVHGKGSCRSVAGLVQTVQDCSGTEPTRNRAAKNPSTPPLCA